MNPEKQHKKLLNLQEKAQTVTKREEVKKILKKYKKAETKLEAANKEQ